MNRVGADQPNQELAESGDRRRECDIRYGWLPLNAPLRSAIIRKLTEVTRRITAQSEEFALLAHSITCCRTVSMDGIFTLAVPSPRTICLTPSGVLIGRL